MKYFFDIGNRYVKESDWKDLALIKFCLCAMGVLIGLTIPKSNKKAVAVGATGVFLGTYIPLMSKLFKIMRNKNK